MKNDSYFFIEKMSKQEYDAKKKKKSLKVLQQSLREEIKMNNLELIENERRIYNANRISANYN